MLELPPEKKRDCVAKATYTKAEMSEILEAVLLVESRSVADWLHKTTLREARKINRRVSQRREVEP